MRSKRISKIITCMLMTFAMLSSCVLPAFASGSASGTTKDKEPDTVNVDLAFVIDTTGSMSNAITNVKNNISEFVSYLEEGGVSIRVAIVEYRDITCDGSSSTVIHKLNNSTWHTTTADMQETLSELKVGGGGDLPETPIDALGYLIDDDSLYWSSKAYKFAVLLTDADYKNNNNHGISNMNEMIDLLVEKEINTSVITRTSYKSCYNNLYEKTGGIFADIYSTDFADELIALADRIISATTENKAIYVLPGYMGSQLYYNGNKMWMDPTALKDDITKFFLIGGEDTKFKLKSDGSGSLLSVDMEDDLYGTFDTYKGVVEELESQFGGEDGEYDVIFFPYNWLGDLNDSVVELENHINDNGYDKVVFVTHSTGGLLASAYTARNKEKVLKNILIAPPLFGTYTSLQPIETGKVTDIESMLEDNGIENETIAVFWKQYDIIYDWIKYVTKNSPTTYQLLPSIEYLRLMPVMYEDEFADGTAVMSREKYYSILNESENINSNLTNGNDRSHRYFRETTLKGDIVEVLQEVDTLLIGSSYGNLTPAIAEYTTTDYFFWTTTEYTDLIMKMDGDGTVMGVSAFGTENVGEHVLAYKDFPGVGHSALVNTDSHPEVIRYVCANIPTAKKSTYSSSTYSLRSRRSMSALSSPASMSDYIKINISANKNATINIVDEDGNVAAYIKEDTVTMSMDGVDYSISKMVSNGFDGKTFVYNPSSSPKEGIIGSIYMPREGYSLEVTYGEEAGSRINFGCVVSTLTDEGEKSASATYVTTVTSDNGVVFTLDLSDVNLSNIGSLCTDGNVISRTEYFLTEWALESEIKLNSVGDEALVNITGSDAGKVSLKWSSSDNEVVSVDDNGKVTAKGYGQAVIAATDGNKTETCKVTVVKEAASIQIDDIKMTVGERVLLRPVFDSENVTETKVDYEYDELAGIISINEYGVILAEGTGSIDVVATASSGVTTSFTVVVTTNGIISVDSVSLSKDSVEMKVNSTEEITAFINPLNAENQKVTWISSNPDIVSVNSDGLVCTLHGMAEGYSKITVVTNDGGYTASADVYVTGGLNKDDVYIESMSVNSGINNTIADRIKITNMSDVEISLNDLVIQYFYDNDKNKNEVFECDWACNRYTGITSLVYGEFGYDSSTGWDVVNIGFKNSSEVLMPGDTLEIHFRVHTSSWNNYYLPNDYSASGNTYAATDRIGLIYEGRVISGDEIEHNNSDAALPTIEVCSKDTFEAGMAHYISSRIKIKNTGTKSLDLSKFEIVYQYNNDGNTNESFWCDWASCNNASVTGSITGSIHTVSETGDAEIEITAIGSDAVLHPGEELVIHFRVANSTWNDYDLSNDISYNGTSYSINNNIPVYYDGVLISMS
ncbi:MAG: Ig-like domain-containing protein [Butyrivibrio sp.]